MLGVNPVNAAVRAVPDALDANGDCEAVAVLLPVVSVESVPQVNVTVEDAPLEVPVPFIVTVVTVTEVAGFVVTAGKGAAVVVN